MKYCSSSLEICACWRLTEADVEHDVAVGMAAQDGAIAQDLQILAGAIPF